MPILAGIGFSQNKDTIEAAKEAAVRAKKNLGSDRIDLAILFNTVHYKPEEFLPVAHEILNLTRVIGCSTAGIILTNRIETRGIGIAALNSDRIRFETAHQNRLDLQDQFVAGLSVAKECARDFGQQNRKLLLFFADGLLKDISTTVKGFKSHLGEDFLVLGAGSSDDLLLHKTYQYCNDKILTKGVVAAILGGQPLVAFSCKHGWRALGKPRVIDKVDGHLIRSIDKKKAFHLLEEYFADEARTIPLNAMGPINVRHPLGVRLDISNDYLLRNVLGVLDDGSIICQDTVERGSEVHIMINNAESCFSAAEEAARDIRQQLKEFNPGLLLIFESAHRLKMLGKNAPKEIAAFSKIMNSENIFGMYSYGEIYSFSPVKNVKRTLWQNDSLLAIAIS